VAEPINVNSYILPGEHVIVGRRYRVGERPAGSTEAWVWSNWSDPAVAMTGPPGTPTGLVVTPGDGQAVHTFSAPADVGGGITDYVIETELVVLAAVLSFESSSETTITVSRNSVTDADEYRLESGASVSGPWSTVTVSMGAEYTLSGLEPDTTVWLRVVPIFAAVDGTPSDVLTVTTTSEQWETVAAGAQITQPVIDPDPPVGVDVQWRLKVWNGSGETAWVVSDVHRIEDWVTVVEDGTPVPQPVVDTGPGLVPGRTYQSRLTVWNVDGSAVMTSSPWVIPPTPEWVLPAKPSTVGTFESFKTVAIMNEYKDPTVSDSLVEMWDMAVGHHFQLTPAITANLKARKMAATAATPDLWFIVYEQGGELTAYNRDISMYAHPGTDENVILRNPSGFVLWLADPTSPMWEDDVVARLGSAFTANPDIAGTMLDVMGNGATSNPYRHASRSTGLHFEPIVRTAPWNKATGAPYQAFAWMTQTSGLGGRVKARVDPTRLIGANGLGTAIGYWGNTRLLTNTLDLGVSELFLRDPGSLPTTFQAEATLLDAVDMVVDTDNVKKKAIVAYTKVWPERDGHPSATTAQLDQWKGFSAAAFLLGTTGRSFWSFSDRWAFGPIATKPTMRSQWDSRWAGIQVGHPVDELYRRPTTRSTPAPPAAVSTRTGLTHQSSGSGCYSRTFSNGLVLWNPTGTAQTHTLGQAYYDVMTQTTVGPGSLTVAAHTGRILRKS
jgi:hypothetical protein